MPATTNPGDPIDIARRNVPADRHGRSNASCSHSREP